MPNKSHSTGDTKTETTAKTASKEKFVPGDAGKQTDDSSDTAAAADTSTRDESKPYKDAAEAQKDLGTDYPFGERRSDGEIEGVTVNTDRYQGAKFENLHADYRKSSLDASQK